MDIWFVMFLSNLLIPLLMLGIGLKFYTKPPRKINSFYGYRTKLSMQNDDAWIYANIHYGKMSILVGSFLTLVSLIVMILFRNSNDSIIETVGIVLMFFELGVICLSFIPTQIALKKKFKREN